MAGFLFLSRYIDVLNLSMRGVPMVDTSGLQALEELYHELKIRAAH
ncbi:MAG: STAS domain-containing protein [Firmicutes bacterium]|nr:STAS domain-containing protein [Bacillota bacterium]